MDEFVRIMNASHTHTHKQRIFQNVAVENPGIATSPKNKWANKATEKKGKEEGEKSVNAKIYAKDISLVN